MHSELISFHLISHLFMFSASVEGNECIDLSRATLIYSEIET